MKIVSKGEGASWVYLGGWGLAVCALFASGCSERKPRPGWAIVSGTVTYQGKPVPAGDILMSPTSDPNVFASGKLGSNGSFVMEVPVGAVKVGIQTADVKAAHPDRYVQLPSQYGNPQKSGLTYEVKAGKNADAKFDLK